MARARLISLLGLICLLPGNGVYSRPDIIYEEFIDQELDGYVEMYVISTPRYPEKTRVLISAEFADKVCRISHNIQDLIRVNYKSRFTAGVELVKPEIMDRVTQNETNKRNQLAVLTNGIIITR
ncbi:hypothetical protein J4423_04280 [Candidatus Pacearchaeota archaeon]|nr:hypothetical protein [Candidatus Pacearchaeota archaeon]